MFPLEWREDSPPEGMARFLPAKPEPTERPDLDPPRIRLLSEVVQPEYRMVVLVCGICGLRGCEAFALRRQDMNLETGMITVARSVKPVTGLGFVVDRPKNGKVERVSMGFLQPEFEKHAWGPDHDPLLPSTASPQLPPTALSRVAM